MGNYDTDDFELDVIERSRTIPVVVDFWAEWCGPCRTLGPVMERLAEQADGSWELVKVDTERHPQVAGRYGIRSIPAVKLFIDGEVADEFVGALPEASVREWLARVVPGPSSSGLADARKLLLSGEAESAVERLLEILQSEPANDEARVLLARGLLFADPGAAIEALTSVPAGSRYADEAQSLRDLAETVRAAEEAADLPAGAARDTYVAGLQALQAQDLATALDRFIEVVALDRGYAEDGARRACLAIFRYLGDDHPATRGHRMAFSNAVMA